MTKWIWLLACIGMCVTPVHAQGVTGDDSDRVFAKVHTWQINAKKLAVKTGDSTANGLAKYFIKRGVAVIPIESADFQSVTVRVNLPLECPQVSIAPIRLEDTAKGRVWSELYRLDLLTSYSPDLRLLKVKDVPCTSQFMSICLLSRMKEAEAYSSGENVTLKTVFVRQILGLKYFEKLSEQVYGPSLIEWIHHKERPNTHSPLRLQRELDHILGLSLSLDEQAERKRQIYFWTLFDRLSNRYTGQALEDAEVAALQKSYTLQ